MNVNFIDAISTLFALQRWNFVPRVETWVEAENVAYVAHLIYAVGLCADLSPQQVEKTLARVIIKSFNKHHLSDISQYTRKAINDSKIGLWEEIEKEVCKDTLSLFPKEVHGYIEENMISPLLDPEDEKTVEGKLLRFVQMDVAKSECETNKRAYPENPYYVDLIRELDSDVQRFRDVDDFRNSMSQLKKYNEYIKNMKYLRRWNQINRSVETSVMSHTFVVAALALVTSCIEVSNQELDLPDNFTYRAILRALFHDVAEAFTGDIITSVKNRIKKHFDNDWSKIERLRLQPLINEMPINLKNDMEKYELINNLPSDDEDIVGKLVKECDRLSMLLECIFEQSTGRIYSEMDEAFNESAKTLLSSPWRSIREITLYGLFRKDPRH